MDESRQMKKALKILVLLIILALMGYGLYMGLSKPELRPVVISPYEGPIIQPAERRVDLGRIPMDAKVHHSFLVYNTGGQRLRIYSVEPSCGCTVARLSRQEIKPGEFAQLDVDLDTSIKLGPVEKTITVRSNDPDTPVLELLLVGEVFSTLNGDGESHGQIAVKDPLVLFHGDCARCHVDKGRGKTGQALFQADCAMCHGSSAQGAVAKGLLEGDFSQETHLANLRRVITEGSPNTPTMPPFGQAHGGPLNEDEIESLINYLRYEAMLAQQQAALGSSPKNASESPLD